LLILLNSMAPTPLIFMLIFFKQWLPLSYTLPLPAPPPLGHLWNIHLVDYWYIFCAMRVANVALEFKHLTLSIWASIDTAIEHCELLMLALENKYFWMLWLPLFVYWNEWSHLHWHVKHFSPVSCSWWISFKIVWT
jgi:hypothetical protein